MRPWRSTVAAAGAWKKPTSTDPSRLRVTYAGYAWDAPMPTQSNSTLSRPVRRACRMACSTSAWENAVRGMDPGRAATWR
jgi:hypothetical protein